MYIKKEICLLLFASLTLFMALITGNLHSTTGGSHVPAISIADGTEPPPPPYPKPPSMGLFV
jgi:hypothetical protein